MGTPDTDKDNEFLLKVFQCGEELRKKLPKKEVDDIMGSIFEDMRKYMNLPNKVLTIGTNDERTMGYIVFFDKEPDGIKRDIFHDKNGYYIKVYEED